jgi:hypothetical protein
VTHWLDQSLVLASDYRVPDPAHVSPLLRRRQNGLIDLGAHHALTYESTTERGRVLVVLALHAREPVLDVMRSRVFFDYFDAVGVEDIPAVFAGELVERVDLVEESIPAAPEVMVSMIAPVQDLQRLRQLVRESAESFRAAGVQKLLLFSAFDNPLEVMLMLHTDNEAHARSWLHDSDLAHEWLDRAGVGAYPPVFVGKLQGMIRVGESDGEGEG